MNALGVLLKEKIAAEGPLSLHDYMQAALTHPEYGYYSRKEPFGAAGDFVTAPEISQMFGELVGLWCVDVWMKLGSPARFFLMELGPGNGTLMADLYRSTKLVPPFLEAAELHLVEASDKLKNRQAERLQGVHITWHDTLPELSGQPVILIANEFFDALPIHQYCREKGQWFERLVDYGSNGFRYALADRPSDLPDAPAGAKDGDIFETCPEAHDIVRRIARMLEKTSGAALIIDYGPEDAEIGDSFQALRAHRFADPLNAPGEADLTAHVKFPALLRTATRYGMTCFGPTTQGRFLERLGIEARHLLLSRNATEAQKNTLATELRRLTSAREMGTLFKVLALTNGLNAPPEGFGA